MIDNRLKIGSNEPEMLRYGNRMVDSVCIKTPVNAFDPILNISAKGLTTAGIAQSGGVVDLSGNGNNGTAYGGVEVVNDSLMGECFNFTSGQIEGSVKFGRTFTLFMRIKSNQELQNGYACYFETNKAAQGYLTIDTGPSATRPLYISLFNNGNQRLAAYSFAPPSTNEILNLVVVVEWDSQQLKIFTNGELKAVVSITMPETIRLPETFSSYRIGSLGTAYYINAKISEVKIFPYALNEHQIQALYSGTLKLWENLPSGAVLDITARGLTTAGIAESGGVTDLSGNGNNGTAYGGLEVVNDSEIGKCFSFDGSNDYLLINKSSIVSKINTLGQITICCDFKISTLSSTARYTVSAFGSTRCLMGIYVNPSNKLDVAARIRDADDFRHAILDTKLQINTKYSAVGVFDFTNGKVKLYVDGVFVTETDTVSTGIVSSLTKIEVGENGNSLYRIDGLISDIKIFPYALTPQQVKRLYHFACYPKNPILDINAKGLTTAGIAQSGGVIDLSGNGNNGTAYGGVEVVNDPEMGDCFYFDGARGKFIEVNNQSFIDLFNGENKNSTIQFVFKCSGLERIGGFTNSRTYIMNGLYTYSDRHSFSVRSHSYTDTTIGVGTLNKIEVSHNKFYTVTGVFDRTNKKIKIYNNGGFINEYSSQFSDIQDDITEFQLGRHGYNYFFSGLIQSVKVYNRALSDEEVKSLYLHSHQYMLDHHGV